jgi:hypothetical protein|tara:strand:+ start:81 stop:272 length:192 start_codon:yes stop_codon:yes gene_type:complete
MHLDYLDINALTIADLQFYIRDLDGHIDDFKMMRKWNLVRECESEKKLMKVKQLELSDLILGL